jgi:hypothetical protein
MPVILTTDEERDIRMRAMGEAGELQRPLARRALEIVARGEREDPPAVGPAQPSLL